MRFVPIVLCVAGLLACNRTTDSTAPKGRVNVEGAQPGSGYVEGHVQSATESVLRLDTDKRVFKVEPTTTVTLDDQPSKVLDLPEGAEVRASFKEVDGQSVVTDIVARTRRGEGQNAATPQGAPKVR